MEDYLQAEAVKLGGVAEKWGVDGWPDRSVVLPEGVVGFLELKRPGEEPSKLQAARLAALRKLGVVASWADSFSGGQAFLKELAGPPVLIDYETCANQVAAEAAAGG